MRRRRQRDAATWVRCAASLPPAREQRDDQREREPPSDERVARGRQGATGERDRRVLRATRAEGGRGGGRSAWVHEGRGEVVRELDGRGEALRGATREGAKEHVVEGGGELRTQLRGRRHGVVRDRVRDRDRVFARKRPDPAERFVEHRREREHVAARRVLAAGDRLGRRVRGGAEKLPVAGQLCVGNARDAEVGQLHAAVYRQQNVVGLDVSVKDLCRVQRVERRGDPAPDGDYFSGLHAPLLNLRPQRGPGDVLVHEVGPELRVYPRVVHPDHVRVVEARGRAGLVAKPGDIRVARVARRVEPQHFDGHLAAQLRVVREVDPPHGPFAQQPRHLIAPQRTNRLGARPSGGFGVRRR